MLSNRGIAGCSLMLGAGCLMIAVLGAAQALNVKPGLWEVTSTSQMGDSMRNSKPTTKRECMTKERIEKETFQDEDMGKNCTRTSIASTSSLQEFKMVCTGAMKGSGTMRLEAANPENVKGTMTMNAESGGQTMNMNFTFVGKWLSANCGNVK